MGDLLCVRARMNRNSLKWHLIEGQATYDFTLHDFGGPLGRHLDTFFWALTVMALGLCVKWP